MSERRNSSTCALNESNPSLIIALSSAEKSNSPPRWGNINEVDTRTITIIALGVQRGPCRDEENSDPTASCEQGIDQAFYERMPEYEAEATLLLAPFLSCGALTLFPRLMDQVTPQALRRSRRVKGGRGVLL